MVDDFLRSEQKNNQMTLHNQLTRSTMVTEKIAANLTEWMERLTDGVFRICHFV
jgi:hypothetical protein